MKEKTECTHRPFLVGALVCGGIIWTLFIIGLVLILPRLPYLFPLVYLAALLPFMSWCGAVWYLTHDCGLPRKY